MDKSIEMNEQIDNNIMLELSNVSKLFKGGDGIKELSFQVRKGSFHALIGPNGAGKTTMIRTILRLYQEYAGEIKINGVSTKEVAVMKNVSYIGEKSEFPTEFSLKKYLLWAGRLKGFEDFKILNDIDVLCEKFGISSLIKRNPNRFSSGQKQKVMLVKMLIENNDFIIMDEPTANLDPSSRIVFFDAVRDMNKQGKTVLICSHNLEEMEDKVDYVTVLKNGRISFTGPKDGSLIDTFKKYAHESDVKND